MNIGKNKWPQFDVARIANGTDRFPPDGESVKAGGGRHAALVRMVGRRKEKEKNDAR